MTITVRQVRRGTVVRLTGAHAQALTGLLLNLLEGAESAANAAERVPDRSGINGQALGADTGSAARGEPACWIDGGDLDQLAETGMGGVLGWPDDGGDPRRVPVYRTAG